MENDLDCKSQKGLRKYFANNKTFVIRIRKNGDILYYKGIKILAMSSKNLTVSSDVVQFNKASILKAITNAKNNKFSNANLDEIVKNEILTNINDMRKEMIEDGILYIKKDDCNIKIERNYKKNLSKLDHNGLDKILEYLNTCKTINVDIEYIKEYKIKDRPKLSNLEDKEKELWNLANKRKNKLENKLNAKLNNEIRYQQNQWALSEENLKKYSLEEQEKRENNWNKIYVLSYTLASSEELETKKSIQNILCSDENFDDNKEIEKQEYFEINDYIIYHLKFNSSNEEKITEEESKELANIEYEIIRNRIFDENLEYHQISKPTFSTVIGKSQYIENIKNLSDVDNLTTKMKNQVEKYIKNVKEEVEKHYQFQFMIQDETKQKIKNVNENAKNQTIYPFEQEYFILNRKGRIDAIFFGIKEHMADLYLIELKVNESVIGGQNGVHKHLSDIYKLLSQETTRTDFLDSIKEFLNYRFQVLDETEEPETIKKIDTIHFWTIIGYTDDTHKEVSQKLLDFYYNHDPSNKDTKNKLKELKSLYSSLNNIDISIPKSSKPLKEYIDELNKINIDIKFFFDSTDSISIDDKPAYRIKENEFELVEFKNN